MTPRLKITYEKEIISKLMSKLSLKNKHEVPRIVKIILNMGLGEDGADGKKLKACADDMALIAGQKPIITKFKKSISNFKPQIIIHLAAQAGVRYSIINPKIYLKSNIEGTFNIIEIAKKINVKHLIIGSSS